MFCEVMMLNVAEVMNFLASHRAVLYIAIYTHGRSPRFTIPLATKSPRVPMSGLVDDLTSVVAGATSAVNSALSVLVPTDASSSTVPSSEVSMLR